jgi:regulator of replication initiation timing
MTSMTNRPTPTNQPLTPEQRTRLLDQLFQRIAKMDDTNLLAADRAISDVEQGQMPTLPSRPTIYTPPPDLQRLRDEYRQGAAPATANRTRNAQTGIGRRGFLIGLITGGVVTGVAGGTAVVMTYDQRVRDWLSTQGMLPSATAIPPTPTITPTIPPPLPVEIVDQIEALQRQIDALTAERDALKTRVDGLEQTLLDANAEISTLKGDLSIVTTERDDLKLTADKLRDDLKALGDQADALQVKLTNAEQTSQKRASLLRRYGDLDSADLDSAVTTGMAGTAAALATLMQQRDPLVNGLNVVRERVTTVEEQMGEINAGLDWLDREVATLTANYRAFQTALKALPGTLAGSSTTEFAREVAAALPFTVSQEIKLAVQAMGAVIARLPAFLDNVNRMSIVPARLWVVPSNDKQAGLFGLLLTPMQGNLLSPVEKMVNSAENLELVYNKDLAQPAQRLLLQRSQIRAEITQEAGALN